MSIWSSAPNEPRARRPTDGALLILATIGLGIIVQARPGGGSTARAVASLLVGWTFLHHVWWTLMVLATLLAIALFVVALVARRWLLCRDLVVGAVFAALSMVLLHHLLTGSPNAIVEAFLPAGSKPLPIVRLALVTTVFAVASPFLCRPVRYATHVTVAAMTLATLALGGTNPNGALAALSTAWIAAAGVHLLFGSPGGRPSAERVEADLAALDLHVDTLGAGTLRSDGVAHFVGTTADGPIILDVFGRDAWSGQFFAALSRFLAFRGPGATLSATRIQQAEHEALMLLVATQAGAGVPAPIVVSRTPNADVILATTPGETRPIELATAANLASVWQLLDRLHDGGVVHRAISAGQLAVDSDDEPMFVDLSRAVLANDQRSRMIDRAQLMATTIVAAGVAPALDAFLEHDHDDAEAMLRYLQPAVLTSDVRDELKAMSIDLGEVRTLLAERCDLEVPELEKVRRVTRGAVVMTLLIGIAAMFVVSTFADLDWEEIRHALDSANWWWLIFAFIMAQAPRLGGGLSMLGACRTPLPYGPVFLLQFSFPFIDVAAPAAAGRIAATMRFQQKYGVPAASAFSASLIDSGAGFASQLLLLGLTFAVTDLNLSTLGGDNFDIDFRLLLTIVVVIGFVISLLLAIPAIRRRLAGPTRDVWTALAVLKSPAKFALLLGGSALSEMLYAVAMAICLRSLGQSVPYTSVLVVTAFVRFISGVSPIPGGLGIAEAGLTAGLVAVGVPVEFAFPAAMIYRLCTFYVPPAYGWAVLGVLRRHDYL